MPQSSRIIVIADDLSGAAELAGIAFARGLAAEVHREFDPFSTAQVIAVDTDSRSLPANAAAKRMSYVVDKALATRPAWIFKKVDSVLRGNPRAEIEAVLRATGLPRALLVPANPSRGRVIDRGRYFIDGVPLDNTPLASDVEHPRQSADVQALLGEGEYPVRLISSSAELPADGVIVPDVSTQADLARFTCLSDSLTLVAGAADFFTALLADRSQVATLTPGTKFSQSPEIQSPALLVCGSRTSWGVRRAACRAAEIPIFAIGESGAAPPHFDALLLGIDDQGPPAGHDEALKILAEAAGSIIQNASVNTILAEGGATAAAIAQRLGWDRFEVVATAPAGVGVLKPIVARSPLVLIKPGSYPWPQEIWDAFCGGHK